MKLFWTGYVAFMALGTTTVRAELTHDTTLSGIRSQSSPTYFSERWIQGCDWFGRNDDDKEDGPTAPTPTAPTPTAPTPTAPTPTAPTPTAPTPTAPTPTAPTPTAPTPTAPTPTASTPTAPTPTAPTPTAPTPTAPTPTAPTPTAPTPTAPTPTAPTPTAPTPTAPTPTAPTPTAPTPTAPTPTAPTPTAPTPTAPTPTAPTPTAPTPTAPTPTAPTPTAPTDQCQGLTVCNEQHEFITSVLAENGTYVCGCNLCDDRLTVTCDECSGCNGLEGKDVCIESIFIYDFIDQKNGTYEWTGADLNITSTGVDSASNQVHFDYDSVVRDTTFNWLLFNETLNGNSTNEDSDFEVFLFIDGVRCNSFSFSGDGLCELIIDCRNIDPDYYWDSCDDFFGIYENSSHPLHGWVGGSLYCPDDEAEISAEAVSTEGKISMGGEPFRLPGHPRFPF